ncbi:hypothetical protein XELAEV_18038706mg [Xenopus laevis]|uniref:Uncharacterized protein n=1 Tax=Xenopus laevis TaxID=8355 RepID=A0A974C7P5_XENLA|nr:hypothetical protein XELAEV_18038706mg [Xenopus laevis]
MLKCLCISSFRDKINEPLQARWRIRSLQGTKIQLHTTLGLQKFKRTIDIQINLYEPGCSLIQGYSIGQNCADIFAMLLPGIYGLPQVLL